MKLKISALKDPTKEQFKQICRIIDLCNHFDGTAYPFDPDDDYNRPGDINHFILYCDDRPVSAAYLFVPTSAEAEVYGFTLPEQREKGFFKSLINEVEKEIRRRSIGSLLFVCDRKSSGGLAFIEHQETQYEHSEYSMKWIASDLSMPEMPVSLRPAVESDRRRLVEINSEAFHENRKDAEDFVDTFISSPQRDFYTIEYCGETVGMIGRYIEENRDYIHGFSIASEFRGRGIGRQALLWMVKHCRNLDSSRTIELEVETGNEKALGLYKSCGFILENVYNYYRKTLP